MSLPLSILDTVPVTDETPGPAALAATTELCRLADRLGYTRYWLAEHHGLPSVASTATEVIIAHLAAHTDRIRLGAGGVMLLNHAPLAVAERYHTLAALHPGRIDLGLGRAPGGSPAAMHALGASAPHAFPSMLAEMRGLSDGTLPARHPAASLTVMPEAPLPPIWLLGSSGNSASFAGSAGLGYAFASHFSPTPAAPAFAEYRAAFRPDPRGHQRPHAILAVSVVCADTDAEARHLAGTVKLSFARLRSGRLERLPHPDEAARHVYSPTERAVMNSIDELVITGTPEAVKAQIEAKAAACEADEVMVTSFVYDPADRARGYTLLADAFGLAPAAAA